MRLTALAPAPLTDTPTSPPDTATEPAKTVAIDSLAGDRIERQRAGSIDAGVEDIGLYFGRVLHKVHEPPLRLVGVVEPDQPVVVPRRHRRRLGREVFGSYVLVDVAALGPAAILTVSPVTIEAGLSPVE